MRISGFTTTRPNMPDTRTYEDFMKFLGELLLKFFGAENKFCELLEARH